MEAVLCILKRIIEFKNQVLIQVLDIGCGTGGTAFYLAGQYGVQVDGIDTSTTMVAIVNRTFWLVNHVTEEFSFQHLFSGKRVQERC